MDAPQAVALITLHANRPQYSARVLGAMDHQSAGLFHFAGLEDISGYKEAIFSLIEERYSSYTGTRCTFNVGHHHTNNNLRCALKAFLESDCEAYIYLEDDTLPSKGAIEYLRREYAKHVGKPGFSHVCLCPKQDGRPVTPENLELSETNETWVGLWGYMAPRKMAKVLLEIVPEIKKGEQDEGRVWDQVYSDYFLKNKLYCVQPYIARMQNIGDEGGLHRGGHTWATWEGEKRVAAVPYVQLGRYGDILNILPVLHHRYLETGEVQKLIVAKQFADILESCSYIHPMIFDGDFREIGKAMQHFGMGIPTQVVGKKAVISQVYGLKYSTAIKLDSFAKESWRLAGAEQLWRSSPALVLDNRNAEREKELSSTIKGKFVLVFTDGHSSPFQHERLLLQMAEQWFPKRKVVHNPRAERLTDIVALMERADAIIATDSAPLHLAQAVPHKPVIALIADTPSLWHGTALRKNHVAYARYSRFPEEIPQMTESLQEIGKDADILHVFSNYTMSGGAMERYKVARQTWKKGYLLGLTDSYFARNIEGVPYIKDMLRLACVKAKSDDSVILLHNSDTCFYEGAEEGAIEAVAQNGSCFSCRHDYQGTPRIVESKEGFNVYPGSDLFAFTVRWWRENQGEYPDLVLGREAWDMVMRAMIQRKGGKDITGSIYHFRHPTKWEADRMKDKGNIHNRRLARQWMKDRKISLGSLSFSERL